MISLPSSSGSGDSVGSDEIEPCWPRHEPPPQSAQSVPSAHCLLCFPGPPSSHHPSLAHVGLPMHSLVHTSTHAGGDGGDTIARFSGLSGVTMSISSSSAVGDGNGFSRQLSPQSSQSVPSAQRSVLHPGPPSSHQPSFV